MKAAGISAHQILAPLVLASFAVAALTFVFNEAVVVKAARTVTAWSDNEYRPVPAESGILTDVWLLSGDDHIRARHVGGTGADFHAERVTIYHRAGGVLQKIVQAERAVPSGTGWQLQNVRTYDATMNLVRKEKVVKGMEGVSPEALTLAKVDPDELDFFTLKKRIGQMEAAGRPTEQAEAGLWHKISGPMSAVLMPLLAAVAAFGLARSGQVLLRAVTGMALGFAYFVADNFSIAMGNVGAYPPLLAAWAPFLLFLLIGETVLIRSEE
jgi:lipopolysaccharide export system permease protein